MQGGKKNKGDQTAMAIELRNRKGFDAAVDAKEDDTLNRWPFADEIYRIATTGPDEWSVRIGVYGEWGTGKTSVLKLLALMAERDGHILVWFNPWEYATRDSMWRAFVLSVYKDLNRVIGNVQGGAKTKLKDWIGKSGGIAAKVLAGTVDLFSEKLGDASEAGLDFLKQYLAFGEKDIAQIRKLLGDRRIIVIVDDLDRTNPGLVPEMLFALKEIMDQPGFSFVTAFDPVVVGQVLGKYHPGFGNGLNFLEKIIDYPRWIPPPSDEGMLKLAESDISEYCPYVPIPALREVIPLLPKNPRAVRQYLRILALLQDQVKRHRADELNWPVILAANVIKIRFSRLAYSLLEDHDLWRDAYGITLMRKDGEEAKLDKLISEHVDRTVKAQGVTLSDPERQQVIAAMTDLAERLDVWSGIRKENLVYQLHIAEAPAAVTWKEHDQFVATMAKMCTATAANQWIDKHAQSVSRSSSEVFIELFHATVRSRQEALSRVAEESTQKKMYPALQKADLLMKILEVLTFELENICVTDKRLSASDFKIVLESLLYYSGFTDLPVYRKYRARESRYLRKFVQKWGAPVSPLIEVLEPYSDSFHRSFESKEAQEQYRVLADYVIPRFAKEILGRFGELGFVQNIVRRQGEVHNIKCVLLDVDGPLWRGLQTGVLKALRTADRDDGLHDNVYNLITWFDYKLRREQGYKDTEAAKKLLQDHKLGPALWNAVVARPLNPRAIGSLKEIAGRLETIGVNVRLPKWWAREPKEA